jgi:serine/threonine protein kinase
MNQDIVLSLQRVQVFLLGLITKGVYGKIYDCLYLDKRYILKVQSIDETTSVDCVAREIKNQIVASNLGVSPRVILYGILNDISWFMMERIDGCTLELYMYQKYANLDGWIEEHLYDEIKASDLCIKIRCRIDTLQHHGIFHLDLHSSNILIDSKDQVYIIDFGNSVIENCVNKQQHYKSIDEQCLSEFIVKN